MACQLLLLLLAWLLLACLLLQLACLLLQLLLLWVLLTCLLLACLLLAWLLPRGPLGLGLRRRRPLLPGGAGVLRRSWPGHGSCGEGDRHELPRGQVLLHGGLRGGVGHEGGRRRLPGQLHP